MKKINKEYEMQLVEERNVTGLPADNVERINEVVKIHLQKLAGMLEYGGQWMVTVFNESKLCVENQNISDVESNRSDRRNHWPSQIAE
jgi:hypothetical protein